MNKKIVMFFVGSDIRCNKPVLDGKIDKIDCNFCGYPCAFEKKINRVKYWGKNADIIFSGLDNSQILDHFEIPYHLVTLPIDIDQWKPPQNKHLQNEKPLILHAPSNYQLKGTDIVLETIKKLKEKYDFDFQLLSNLPNDEVKKWLSRADIVIDRAIGRGWYGKLAVESMAMSNMVIGCIEPKFKDQVKYGQDLPIISVHDKPLHDVLSYHLENRESIKEYGKKSRAFIEKNHNQHRVGQELLSLYKNKLAFHTE